MTSYMHTVTWDQLIERLFEAIQSGYADIYDLSAVRNWPDHDSSETPLAYFGVEIEDWPAWFTAAVDLKAR